MNNFNQGKIVIDKTEIQNLYKRQLDLVKENQELTRDVEFRDYRIMKLEKELRDMQAMIRNITKSQQEKESKVIYEKYEKYERISIYG